MYITIYTYVANYPKMYYNLAIATVIINVFSSQTHALLATYIVHDSTYAYSFHIEHTLSFYDKNNMIAAKLHSAWLYNNDNITTCMQYLIISIHAVLDNKHTLLSSPVIAIIIVTCIHAHDTYSSHASAHVCIM